MESVNSNESTHNIGINQYQNFGKINSSQKSNELVIVYIEYHVSVIQLYKDYVREG